MTNCEMLEEKIKISGYTIKFIANSLGLSSQGFYNKRKGIREFTVEEMIKLCKLLSISQTEREQIFLTQK